MKIRDIILWILFLISATMVIWYFFGNSPTFEQTILILILTILFGIATKVSSISTKINYLEKKFIKLENAFIILKDNISIKNKFKNIK